MPKGTRWCDRTATRNESSSFEYCSGFFLEINEMHHELKCWPRPFEAHANGELPVTIRQNDRNFQPTDTITMTEYVPDLEIEHPTGYWTGRTAGFIVNRVFTNVVGLQPGYALLTLRPLVIR